MTTLSVPIPAHMEEFINSQVKNGFASNKAEVVRKAIRLLSEEIAVRDILEAQQEVREGKLLSGDPRELLKRFK